MKTIREASLEFQQDYQTLLEERASHSGFIAGVEFAQHWISVDDELPENSDEEHFYLVKLSSSATNIPFLARSFRNNKFWTLTWAEMKSVTHWRPVELK